MIIINVRKVIQCLTGYGVDQKQNRGRQLEGWTETERGDTRKRWPTSRLIASAKRNVSNKEGSKNGLENEEPIPYSTSKAANWPASYSRQVPSRRPSAEAPIIMGCVAVILIYFCLVREENDIDLMLAETFPTLYTDFKEDTSESKQ